MCKFKLFGQMVTKRKAYTLSIVIIILLSSFMLNPVTGSHENPDEAEEDLDGFFDTLDRSKEKIEASLQEGLWVNYTLEEDVEEILYDEYEQEHLNRSKKIAEELKEELLKADQVLEEIEGEVESAEYLEQYFVPFSRISEDLVDYTRRHSYLIENLTEAVDLLGEDDIDQQVTYSLHNLDVMRDIFTSIEKDVLNIDEEIFDLTQLMGDEEGRIDENDALLERYNKTIRELMLKGEVSDFTIFGPDIAHPGETINITGYFLDEGEPIDNASISLFKDDDWVDSTDTEDGRYRFNYTIGWDHELNETVFSARPENSDSENLTANITVKIVRNPSKIQLETDKEAYYDETIEIFGNFKTDANINLTDIQLNVSTTTTLFPEEDGSFNLTYESREFRWGKTNLTVEYPGNETISGTSEKVSIEVSIPTEIVDFEYSKELEEDALDEFFVKGRLINASSKQGLEGHNLTVFLDGEFVGEIETGEDGYFTFSLPEDRDLDVGRHTLSVSFEGPEKYRSLESDDILIEVREKTMFWNSPFFLAIVLITLAVVSAGAYVVLRKEETEGKSEEDVDEESFEFPSPDVSIPTATSRDEVPTAYRDLLETLQDMGLITISSGKTHREIEDEISDHPQLKQLEEDIKRVTKLFEKALFTDRSIQSNELDSFNSSLSTLAEEVAS